MPTVPRFNPSVELQGLPNVPQSAAGATPDAFGAQIGQDITRAANVGAELVQRRQDREDADSLFRAEVGLKTDYLEFERTERSRKGVDADGAAERASKWWGEAERKYGGGLSNNKQQRLFQQSAARMRMSTGETLMRHAEAEKNRALQESSAARVQTASDTAIGDPTPERIALAKGEITSALDVLGKIRGDPPEAIAASKTKFLGMMHKGIIERLVDTDPDAAKAHFYANKKEIQGSDYAAIEKALELGGLDVKAQTVADDAMTKFSSKAEAFAFVEKTYSGKEEKAIKQELAARFEVRETELENKSTEALGQALEIVAKRGRVPPSLMSQLEPAHRAKVIEHEIANRRGDAAEARARRAEAEGRAVKTDLATWMKIDALRKENPEEFSRTNLLQFADKVSASDLKGFAGMQGKPDQLKEVATIGEQIGNVAGSMGLEKEKRGAFEKATYDALDDATKAKGKPLTYDERQKIIDQQTITMTVERPFWFDKDKKAFELTDEERQKARVVVPDFDKKQITEALKARGRPVTEAAIEALYKRRKGLAP